ncbi:MAG: dihydrolipoyl dehydrogenase [Gammaproteobacteria bacterium]
MKTKRVDVAIIGAGTAGMNARRAVEKAGGRPLMIEADQYGTMCARVGCMPSKLLIAAADAAHEVAAAGAFGIDVPDGWRVDGRAVMKRVRRLRDRFVGGVIRQIEALPEDQLLRGHARFTGPTTLNVGDHTLVEAGAVVIATGSVPHIPPPFDAIRERVMINDDVFELDDLPASIAVIGTGIIGLEIGQAMHRLGVRTTLFARSDRLGPFTDPEVRAVANEILQDELDLRLNTKITAAEPVDAGVRIHFVESDGTAQEETFERVLVATGRIPNVFEVDLQATGLPVDDRGLPAWDPETTQCGDAPIFIAGDASGHIELLHEASDEGRIAGANALAYPDVESHVRRAPLAIAFTDPQIALVGRHHEQLNPDAVEIGQVSFARQGRATVMDRAAGLLRVYGDRESCAIIGAEFFGPRAEHMAHLLAWIVQEGLPVSKVLEMPVYHPVLEEGMRTALRDLARKLKLAGQCRPEDFAAAAGS